MMCKLVAVTVGLTLTFTSVAVRAQTVNRPSDGRTYPVEGVWSGGESMKSYETAQNCTWYREGFLREKQNVALPGDLIVYEGSKRTDFGGYYGEAGTVSNLASVKQIHPNTYRINERYYHDEEGGQSFGWRRRTYELRVIDDNTIEIKDDKTVQKFLLCKDEPSQLEAQARKEKEKQNTRSAEGGPKPSAPMQSDTKPDQLASSANPPIKPADNKTTSRTSLPTGILPEWAGSVEECVHPKDSFFALGSDKSNNVVLNGQVCTPVSMEKLSADPPISGLHFALTCNGTNKTLEIRSQKLKFVDNSFGAISVDGQSPSVSYNCTLVRKSVNDGASISAITANKYPVTKEFLASMYDIYLYAKTCRDYGHGPSNAAAIQAYMRKVDDLAKAEGFNTDTVWQAALEKARQNTVLIILKQGFEAMKTAGSALDRARAVQGCEKYTTVFSSIMDDFRQAQDPEPVIRSFSGAHAPR
jgi:hypothetical protein